MIVLILWFVQSSIAQSVVSGEFISHSLISADTMHTLGWTLLHFLWQGTALAALAAAAMALCRRASTRYAIAVAGLVVMFAMPVATFFYVQQRPAENVLRLSAAAAPQAEQVKSATGGRATAPGSTNSPAHISSLDALPWLVQAWLIGVALLGLRSAGGFLLLEKKRRQMSATISEPVFAMCRDLQSRLGINRAIAYCECTWLQAPAVVGWFRPVVLLPVTALTGFSEDQLQAVIAHELAHIKRLDAFVNVFQVVVETLLFYHPAVWWLNKRIRAEREHCCDDMAVEICGDAVEYARALTLMEEWRSAPALVMAANRGPLRERIFRLLGLKPAGAGARGMGFTAGVVCLTTALLAGNTLLGIAQPRPVSALVANAQSMMGFSRAFAPQAVESNAPQAAPQSKPAPAAKPSPAPEASPITRSQSGSGSSYIDGMKSAGLGGLSIDQLIALKTQDVTPEYVRAMQGLGFHPDVDIVIAMKIQGISPEYVHELSALGLHPDEDEIIAMKVQGVDADYVRSLKDAGFQLDVQDLIAMKVQGVDGAYIAGLRQQGLQVDASDVIGMKVQDITPDYAREMKAVGLNADAQHLIALKIQGVTPDYVKAMRNSGLRDFKDDPDPYIGAKIQGITPEFLSGAMVHGFKDLDLGKVIQLKNLGILNSKGDI